MKKIIQNFIHKLVYSSFRLKRNRLLNNLILKKQLIIGNHTYGFNNLDIHTYKGSEAKIIIGKYCSLSKNITIITGGNHPIEWISTYPFRINWNMSGKYKDGMPYSNGDIIIGNDVWIGTGVTILSGVKVGDGAVIGAGAIVTKDVLPYAMVAGNPAKIIKFRFDKVMIEKLLRIKWWDWDEEKLKGKTSLINSNLIEDFLKDCNQL